MRWRRAAALAPPQPQPNYLGPVLVVALISVTVLYLQIVSKPLWAPSRKISLSSRSTPYCLPCYTGLLLLSHYALANSGLPCGSPLPDDLAITAPYLAIYMIAPLVGFGLLFVSEVLSWVFVSWLGPGSRYQHFRQPIMAVHACTFLHYFLSYVGQGAVQITDRFGRPLYPVRYVMWFVSVSSLGHSVFMLLDAMPQESAQTERLHALLVRYLLAVPVCFGCGFMASWLTGTAAALANLALSFLAFWYLLADMLRMLRIGQAHPLIVSGGNQNQFAAIRVLIVVVWHGFTVIWLLAAADLITPLAEHGLYVLNDLMAKYMILFVSIASVK